MCAVVNILIFGTLLSSLYFIIFISFTRIVYKQPLASVMCTLFYQDQYSNWGVVSLIFGEGNGTPLPYSCLENPMDGGAWWAQSMGSLRVGHD